MPGHITLQLPVSAEEFNKGGKRFEDQLPEANHETGVWADATIFPELTEGDEMNDSEQAAAICGLLQNVEAGTGSSVAELITTEARDAVGFLGSACYAAAIVPIRDGVAWSGLTVEEQAQYLMDALRKFLRTTVESVSNAEGATGPYEFTP